MLEKLDKKVLIAHGKLMFDEYPSEWRELISACDPDGRVIMLRKSTLFGSI